MDKLWQRGGPATELLRLGQLVVCTKQNPFAFVLWVINLEAIHGKVRVDGPVQRTVVVVHGGSLYLGSHI